VNPQRIRVIGGNSPRRTDFRDAEQIFTARNGSSQRRTDFHAAERIFAARNGYSRRRSDLHGPERIFVAKNAVSRRRTEFARPERIGAAPLQQLRPPQRREHDPEAAAESFVPVLAVADPDEGRDEAVV
jgi:hypothetical protein